LDMLLKIKYFHVLPKLSTILVAILMTRKINKSFIYSQNYILELVRMV